jgi:hypothetical protein
MMPGVIPVAGAKTPKLILTTKHVKIIRFI